MKRVMGIAGALLLAWAAFAVTTGRVANVFAIECVGENGVVMNHDHACDEHPEGGGGEGPIPFGLNAKVELADGEAYMLIGKVVILPKQGNSKEPRVLFEVDLKQHPWLANAKRVSNPTYPLEGSISMWRKREGQLIKLVCKAHGRIMNLGRGGEYVISLEGTQNPITVK